MKTKQYNTYDEYGRLIDKNVSLQRAWATIRANPGSKLSKTEVKQCK